MQIIPKYGNNSYLCVVFEIQGIMQIVFEDTDLEELITTGRNSKSTEWWSAYFSASLKVESE